MCRLMGITATDIDPWDKRILMHHMMTVSMGDDDQTYGSGVSDGETSIKSGDPYIASNGLEWVFELRTTLPWIGHVRKPSRGVAGADSLASHPYEFENQGNSFTAAHNGWIANPYVQRQRDVNTDSWHALQSLEHRLHGENIDQEQLQRWVHTFMHGSSYSFLFIQNEMLIGLRGQRSLYRFAVGNGYIINTSAIVIRNMHAFAAAVLEGRGDVEEIPEGTFFMNKEQAHIDIETLPAHTALCWKKKKRVQ